MANLSAIQYSISSGGNLEQLYNDEVAAKLELLQAVRNQSIFLKEILMEICAQSFSMPIVE